MHTTNNTVFTSWFERDRAMVLLESTSGATLLEAWDEDVQVLVEDGFLDPTRWHASAVEYVNWLQAS